ncbi:MAG: hypothetical protein M3R13_04530, partial [Armatimonadota bacterium]|nr:hypothetical protein [Armatimonadota bacterium]
MDGQEHSYRVEFDAAAMRRFDKAEIRFYWKTWLASARRDFVQFALVIMVAIGVYAWQLRGLDQMAALLALILGSTFGSVWNVG